MPVPEMAGSPALDERDAAPGPSTPADAAPVHKRGATPGAPQPQRFERAASTWLDRFAVPREGDPLAAERARALDATMRTSLAAFSGGLAPSSLALAWFDWASNLAQSPGTQLYLLEQGLRRTAEWAASCAPWRGQHGPCVSTLPQDRRFEAPEWQQWPWTLISQGFLLTQTWWQNAITKVPGLDPHHRDVALFATRQVLDRWAPSNFVPTNPVVLKTTLDEGGANLLRGCSNMLEDLARENDRRPPAGAEAFKVGRDLAVTPGRVVFRNRLIELIQYTPATPTVHAEPVLIVPAWIMKYYILDLSPHNSMVRWLVEQGHTVFMISWLNPGAAERDLSMEDYRLLGPMAALDAIGAACPEQKVHTVGYCLGGTLLAIVAASMARDGDERLASMTLLTAQLDFTEPGELGLFVDEGQVTLLEETMRSTGYLDSKQMAGAFTLLRSNDLIWSYRLQNWLLGNRQRVNDLMAWNADATRMPARMHAEYLRAMFLRNDLATGRWETDGRPVSLADIRLPICAISTLADHVAPWRSCFKVHQLVDADITFVLASGGHNGGIVAGPKRDKASFQMRLHKHGDPWVSPDEWLHRAPVHAGSWWPAWEKWVADLSSGQVRADTRRPGMVGGRDRSLCDAPGTYVMQR